MNHTFNKTLIASLLSLAAGGVSASLFQLAEVSTSGLGMAYAGNAAVADNASVVANNPALMTKLRQAQISAGGVLVDTDIIISGTSASGSNAYASNVVPTSVIPNVYFVTPINDKFSLGLGYNVNFGLSSEYPDDYNAGSIGGKTELQAHNFNVSGAYDLGHGFSFGAGVNAIYSKAEVRRTLGDQSKSIETARKGAALLSSLPASMTLSTLAASIPNNPRLQALAAANPEAAATLQSLAKSSPNTTVSQAAAALAATANSLSTMNKSTEVASIKGDEWSFGWNAGLTYDLNENHRWGLAYHSAVDVKFKGKYRNGLTQDMRTSKGTTYATNNQEWDGRLTLNLPAYWELSGWHKLSERVAMQYSWKRTEWSRLKALDAYHDLDGKHLFHKTENFRDSNRYSLGFSFIATPDLTLRTGIAYDRNASVNHPSISIPDTNRVWYSVGATYQITPNTSIDAAYAHLRGTSFSFKEDGAAFKTKARGHLYGLNVNYKF